MHRGCDDGRPLERRKSTVTGGMLAMPFHPDTCDYPSHPPHVFTTRAAVRTRTCNITLFSLVLYEARDAAYLLVNTALPQQYHVKWPADTSFEPLLAFYRRGGLGDE